MGNLSLGTAIRLVHSISMQMKLHPVMSKCATRNLGHYLAMSFPNTQAAMLPAPTQMAKIHSCHICEWTLKTLPNGVSMMIT